MKKCLTLLGLAAAIVLEASLSFAQGAAPTNLQLNNQIKPATKYTIAANKQVYKALDFEDKAELANAARGLIANPKVLEIRDKDNKLVWSQTAYSFLHKDAPTTANPSL